MSTIKLICLVAATLLCCGDLSAQGEKQQRKQKSGQQRGDFMQMFQRLDKNGDKQLTADEIPDRMKQRISRMDLDGDGTIDAEEVQKIAKRMQGRNKGKSQGKSKSKGKGKRGEMQSGQDSQKKSAKRKKNDSKKGRVGKGSGDAVSTEQFIRGFKKRMDKNGDGKITQDEAPDRLKNNWERADKNGNGQLDEDEIKQIAAMAQRLRGAGKGKQSAKGKGKGKDKGWDSSQKKGGGVKPKPPGGSGK